MRSALHRRAISNVSLALSISVVCSSCGPAAIGAAISKAGGTTRVGETFEVTAISPAPGARDVEPDTKVILRFSTAVDTTLAASAVELEDTLDGLVPADVSVLGDTIVLAPRRRLSLLREHVVRVLPEKLRSRNGAALSGVQGTIRFQVRDGRWSAADVVAESLPRSARVVFPFVRRLDGGLFATWVQFEIVNSSIVDPRFYTSTLEDATDIWSPRSLFTRAPVYQVSINRKGLFGYSIPEDSPARRRVLAVDSSGRILYDYYLPIGADEGISGNENGDLAAFWSDSQGSLYVELMNPTRRTTSPPFRSTSISVWSTGMSPSGLAYIVYTERISGDRNVACFDGTSWRVLPSPGIGPVAIGTSTVFTTGLKHELALYAIDTGSIRFTEYDAGRNAWTTVERIVSAPIGTSRVGLGGFADAPSGERALLLSYDVPGATEMRVATYTPGLGWSSPGIVLSSTNLQIRGSWLDFTPDGNGSAVWAVDANATGLKQISFSRFTPSGKWSAPEVIVANGERPFLTLGAAGQIHLIYSRSDGSAIEHRVFR